jgi:hypothetical protein
MMRDAVPYESRVQTKRILTHSELIIQYIPMLRNKIIARGYRKVLNSSKSPQMHCNNILACSVVEIPNLFSSKTPGAEEFSHCINLEDLTRLLDVNQAK